jgi:uncharacterized protein YbjT (DUF2867 family)
MISSRLCAWLLAVAGLAACATGSNVPAAQTVLVGGATGKQGRAVVEELLGRGYRIRALTRNPDGKKAAYLKDLPDVEIVPGDYGDRASLDAAMAGVNKVFFYSGLSFNELEEGRNVIAATKAAGIDRLVYSSGAASEPGKGIRGAKMTLEADIKASGLTYTVFRPVAFMENFAGRQRRFARNGVVESRGPERLLHLIAVSDIGFYVAEAFDDPDRWANTAVNIAGDRLTVAEFVDTLSTVMGRPIEYTQQPLEEYLATMPKPLRPLFRWYDEVGYAADVDAARAEFPNLITLEQYLRATGWENYRE